MSNISNEFIESLAERVDHADCYGGKTWFDSHEGAVIIDALRRLEAYEKASKETVAQESCTCLSGDGSLKWPCPVHAVEI